MAVKDTSTRFPARSTTTFKYVGTAAPATWSQTTEVVNTRTRSGVACPNWFSKIQQGEDATTALTAQYDTVFSSSTAGSGKWSYIPNPTAYTREETIVGSIPVTNGKLNRRPKSPSLSTTAAENGARVQWFRKIRKESVAWSAPTFLGELREAVHMIRKPALSLWRSAGAYMDALERNSRRTGGFKRGTSGARALTKAAGGLWLEYSFGWVPFLNDIQEGLKAYERIWAEIPEQKKISAGYRVSYDRSRELSSYDTPGSLQNHCGVVNYRWRVLSSSWIETHDIRYRGAIRRSVTRPRWENAVELLGFKPLEFIPTAWELMPWSFLIDYATNIGDILQAVATDTSSVVYTSRSSRLFSQYQGIMEGDKAGSVATLGASWQTDSFVKSRAEWIMNRKLLTRSKVGAVPLPTLSLSWDFTDGQRLNVAALLTNAIGLHPQRKRF